MNQKPGRAMEARVYRVSPDRQIQFDYLRKTTFLNLPFPLNIDHFKTFLRNVFVRGNGLIEPGNPVKKKYKILDCEYLLQ